jgi:hypothetical protein
MTAGRPRTSARGEMNPIGSYDRPRASPTVTWRGAWPQTTPRHCLCRSRPRRHGAGVEEALGAHAPGASPLSALRENAGRATREPSQLNDLRGTDRCCGRGAFGPSMFTAASEALSVVVSAGLTFPSGVRLCRSPESPLGPPEAYRKGASGRRRARHRGTPVAAASTGTRARQKAMVENDPRQREIGTRQRAAWAGHGGGEGVSPGRVSGPGVGMSGLHLLASSRDWPRLAWRWFASP